MMGECKRHTSDGVETCSRDTQLMGVETCSRDTQLTGEVNDGEEGETSK